MGGIVKNVNNPISGTVTISGTKTEDQTLTISPNLTDIDGLPSSSEFLYQWFRSSNNSDWNSIASGQTYKLGDEDVGKKIKALVSVKDNNGSLEKKFSDATSAIVNINDLPYGSLLINGVFKEGETLTSDVSQINDDDGLPDLNTFNYQWMQSSDISNASNWANINSATSHSYVLTNNEAHKYIKLVVSFQDNQGQTETISSSSYLVENVNTLPSGSVSITGTPTENETLTINTSALTDADGLPSANTYTYRWEKSQDKIEWDIITGATSTTYALSDPEVGHYLRARISYTDQKQTPEVVYSVISDLIKGVNDNPSGSVTIDGKFEFGKILSANTLGISDADGVGEFSFQWQRSANNSSWNDIKDEVERTYLLRAQDVGQYVRVVTTYTDYQGTTETLSSTGTEVTSVNKLPTGNVTITGNLQEDSTITINTTNLADANGLGTLEYQWQRSTDAETWKTIEGVYSSSYQLDDIDIGSSIRAKVFYKDQMGYFETVFSNTVTGFVAVDDEPVCGVGLDGKIEQYQYLNANVSNLSDPDGLGALEYQWQRSSTQSNFTDIGAATDQTYQLTQEDVSQYVRVVVRYKDGQGFSESVISSPLGKIENVNDKPTGKFVINGTLKEDIVLVADVSQIKDLDGLGTFNYTWEISTDGKTWGVYEGYNKPTLTLDDEHVGYYFRSKVEYTDQSGFFEIVYSDGKGPVTAVNDQATGSISITGLFLIGQVLKIKVDSIKDPDGLTPFTFWYTSANGRLVFGFLLKMLLLTLLKTRTNPNISKLNLVISISKGLRKNFLIYTPRRF